jgi:hypothetical protein
LYLLYFVFSSLPSLPVLAWFAHILTLTICAKWGFDCKSSDLEINRPDAAYLPRQAFFILAEDLGEVDLLVQEGLNSNRTECNCTRIRNPLDKNALEIQQSVMYPSSALSLLAYDRADFIAGVLNLAERYHPGTGALGG